jgi:outer membrane protein OmpA-like peptidoglycan-associated protein/ABC-type nitrate/sulfonate/bicarbonate transport system substrate-binding protein
MHARIAVVVLLVGALGLVGWYVAEPLLERRQQQATSDARGTRGTITIGVDNWVGYFPLCSPVMKRNLRTEGYLLKCEDDQADYAARMRALREGRLEFAVATVDSYLLNGSRENFPGTIVSVIDESKGGDALVARKDVLASIDDLKKRTGVKIAFTPNSPSAHMIKALGAHFDIETLRDARGAWRVETAGSTEARRKLEAREADAAVLWEPDVSRALADPAFTKLLGTEDTEKLIVDILLVRREFSVEQPDTVRTLLAQYFRTLKHYRDHPDELQRDVAEATGSEAEQVDRMLQGVAWATLQENATSWFGVDLEGQASRDGIVDAITSTVQILIDAGDFASDPLPDEDPYRLLHSEPIEWVFQNGVFGAITSGTDTPADPLARPFEALDDAAWERLREIGTLKVRPITFQSGTAELSLEGKRELDKAAENLKHYPNFRVVIAGHSGVRGDAEANRELSRQRAESVARYLTVTYSIAAERLRPLGQGANAPLARRPGESERAYNYRLPRVEMFLVAEVY